MGYLETDTMNLITVRLSKTYDGSGYRWTTKLVPESKTGVGDSLNLSVKVDEQSPLMMAVPIIKEYLTPEERITNDSDQQA